MIPNILRPAAILYLAASSSCAVEARVGSKDVRDSSGGVVASAAAEQAAVATAAAIENEPAKVTQQQQRNAQQDCPQYPTTIRYETRRSTGVYITCERLARAVERGVDISNKCSQRLVNMPNFVDEAIVGDACPMVCGMCEGSGRNSGGGAAWFVLPPTAAADEEGGGEGEGEGEIDDGEDEEESAAMPTATVEDQDEEYEEEEEEQQEEANEEEVNPKPSLATIADIQAIAVADDGEWDSKIFETNLIPIHSILIPDRKGKVLSFGTDDRGKQQADLYFEVWDVAQGTRDKKAHKLLEHVTEADIFCSTMNIDPSTGNVIIMGGDVRNPSAGLGIETVLEFDYKTHKVRNHPLGDMHYARWYGTSINLPNGDIFVVGGRSDDKRKLGSPIPELWTPDDGFRTLKGATIPIMDKEQSKNHWWYPHTYVNSRNAIIVIMPRKANADVYRVSVEGDGDVTRIGKKPFEAHVRSPSIMYRTDRIVMLDDRGYLWTVDISDGDDPDWDRVNDLGDGRTNGSMALMPDGRVAIAGGARSTDNGGSDLSKAVYTIQFWDPETNKVHDGPRQDQARLYHSSMLPMPNGDLLSWGGGAPGPQRNRNGQLFYPNFLFDRNTHDKVPRLTILGCPTNVETTDESFTITVDDASRVNKVTTTKSGASTHTRNCDARWLDLTFEVAGTDRLKVYTEGRNVMIPGLWMLNVLDSNGIPSEASMYGVNMVTLDI